MGIACGVDAICNVNPQKAESLIKHYVHVLSFDSDLVRAEMSLLCAVLADGLLSVATKAKVKEQLQKGVYPNFCKLYRIAFCIPVGTTTCVRSFSAMRRIRNY